MRYVTASDPLRKWRHITMAISFWLLIVSKTLSCLWGAHVHSCLRRCLRRRVEGRLLKWQRRQVGEPAAGGFRVGIHTGGSSQEEGQGVHSR